MKQLLTATLFCLCGCATLFAPRPGSRAHLDSIVIPYLELTDVPFVDAVGNLHDACATHDPRRLQGKPHGFSFIVKTSGQTAAPVHPFKKSTDSLVNASGGSQFPHVSIRATDRSVADVLDDLCNQAGAEFTLPRQGVIVIQPRSSSYQ